jgi:hypothetical protein
VSLPGLNRRGNACELAILAPSFERFIKRPMAESVAPDTSPNRISFQFKNVMHVDELKARFSHVKGAAR